MSEKTERTFTIDGKEYKESDLSLRCRNIIVARAEIQQSKTRHEVELEKIEVLTNYYNGEIKKELEKSDGSDSKSKD
jgi:hypothetical protein